MASTLSSAPFPGGLYSTLSDTKAEATAQSPPVFSDAPGAGDIFSRLPTASTQGRGQDGPWGGARLLPCDPVPWSPPGRASDSGDASVKPPQRPADSPPAATSTNADLWPQIRMQDYPPDPALSPEQQSLHEINLNAARLRSRAAMLQLQENDLGAAQQAHDASLARLQNGVTGPESRQALDQHDYNRADLAVRQHTLRTGREQLQQAQADQDARVQAHQERFAPHFESTLSDTIESDVPSPEAPSGDAAPVPEPAASNDSPAPASPDAAIVPVSPADGDGQPPAVPQPASPPASANDPLAAYEGVIGQTLADLTKDDPDDAARISQRLEKVPPGDREQVLNAIIARHKSGDRGSPQPAPPPGVNTPPVSTESHTISGNPGDITINGVRHVDTGKEPAPAPSEPGFSNHDSGAPLTAEQFMAGLEAGGLHLSPKDRAQIEEIYSRRLKPEPPPTFLDKFLAAVQLPFQGMWNYAVPSRSGDPSANSAAKTLGIDFPMDAEQTQAFQEGTTGLLQIAGALVGGAAIDPETGLPSSKPARPFQSGSFEPQVGLSGTPRPGVNPPPEAQNPPAKQALENGPIRGSGGPGKVYEISAEQQKTPAPYLGKTIRPEVEDRMKDRDHRAKTLDGAPPKAKILAHELTPDEAAGVEALLIKQRGLENLSNKIHGLDVDLPKNQEKIRAGKRVLGQE